MIDIVMLEWIGIVALLLHVLGVLTAIHAVMTARTSQGAIAWALFLTLFPYATLPAYGLFGRGKFQGYVKARRAGDSQIDHIARASGKKDALVSRARRRRQTQSIRPSKNWPKCRSRATTMPSSCINGREAFPAMFAGMEAAKDYIIVQFYIIRDDTLGRQLKALLTRKAREGVRVYVLYDEIGCYHLPRAYRRELAEAGVIILPFRTSRGMRNRFQINFRNHRKIVIADGQVAYVGGLNVGDEYMGRHPKLGPWRDTHGRSPRPGRAGDSIRLSRRLVLGHWRRSRARLDATPRP